MYDHDTAEQLQTRALTIAMVVFAVVVVGVLVGAWFAIRAFL